MGRPTKTLNQLILDGTFRSTKHRDRLLDEDARTPALQELQQRYREARSDPERKAVGLEFEKAVQTGEGGPATFEQLQVELDALGPANSLQRLLGLFPRFFRWDDGSPFNLDPFQRAALKEAHRRDRHGRRVYREIDLFIPRGNGKTPIATGMAIDAGLGPGRPKVFQIAGDVKQAGIGLEYARNWIEDGELAGFFDAHTRVIRRRDGRGYFEILPSSGSGAHGRKPSGAVIVDEKWALETKPQERTYTALETAIFKDPEAYLFSISTAGYDKETIAGQAWDSGFRLPDVTTSRNGFLTVGKDEAAGRLFIAYGMPEGYELDLEDDTAVLRALRLANPGTWIDHRELVRSLRRARDVDEWLRFHLNYWTATKESWLPPGCWAGLRADSPIPPGSDIYVAADAALKYDTTAVAWAARLPDGRIQIEARVWSARPDAPHHVLVPGGRIDNQLAADFITDVLDRRYKVREVVGDPRFFEVFLHYLGARGLLTAEFQQNTGQMRDAEQHFYDDATAGALTWHDPDGIFPQHVAATAAVATSSGWKVHNPQKRNPIDACTAGIMVRERCALGGRRVLVEPWASAW